MDGSDLINENLFSGVCSVNLKNNAGQTQKRGSGFLVKFNISKENKEMLGFLTCYHVISKDLKQADIPGPAQIILNFNCKSNNALEITLSKAQHPDAQPVISPQNDIYFLEVSGKFRNDMANIEIPFYESVNHFQDRQVWIAQYPDNSTERHVANATMAAQWDTQGPLMHHLVSTHFGSSGSPLLQHVREKGSLVVIGMHLGRLTSEIQQNAAVSSANIIQVVNDRILYGRDPPVPSYTPSPAPLSMTSILLFYAYLEMSIRDRMLLHDLSLLIICFLSIINKHYLQVHKN